MPPKPIHLSRLSPLLPWLEAFRRMTPRLTTSLAAWLAVWLAMAGALAGWSLSRGQRAAEAAAWTEARTLPAVRAVQALTALADEARGLEALQLLADDPAERRDALAQLAARRQRIDAQLRAQREHAADDDERRLLADVGLAATAWWTAQDDALRDAAPSSLDRMRRMVTGDSQRAYRRLLGALHAWWSLHDERAARAARRAAESASSTVATALAALGAALLGLAGAAWARWPRPAAGAAGAAARRSGRRAAARLAGAVAADRRGANESARRAPASLDVDLGRLSPAGAGAAPTQAQAQAQVQAQMKVQARRDDVLDIDLGFDLEIDTSILFDPSIDIPLEPSAAATASARPEAVARQTIERLRGTATPPRMPPPTPWPFDADPPADRHPTVSGGDDTRR